MGGKDSRQNSVPAFEPPCGETGCLCHATNAGCRRAYCSNKTNAPGRALPMRALGFPLDMGSTFEPSSLVVTRGTVGKLDVPLSYLPHSPSATFRGVKFRGASCAVVGNSGILKMTQYGAEIDAHDVVVRLNQAPTRGYEKHVGQKTNIRLLNALWSREYSVKQKWINWELPVEPNVTFIASRGETVVQNFKNLYSRMKMSKPDAAVLMISSRVVSKTKLLLGTFRGCMTSGGRSRYNGGGVPSSGLVAAFAFKELCRTVSVYGIGTGSLKV
eukprot:gene651-1083_t